MKTYVLVDFENTPIQHVGFLKNPDLQLILFIGKTQTKLSSDLVVAVQEMGPRARYIRMNGSGKNALDFHIAYHLGQLSRDDPAGQFFIISKDTGFDPLIEHARNESIKIRRLADASALSATTAPSPTPITRIERVHKHLAAHAKNRPARLKTLKGSIHEWLGKDPIVPDDELDGIVAALQTRGLLTVSGTKVVYPN